MNEFPSIGHVALTVRDLSVSVPWYEALFNASPVIDEDTDPDFHHTVYLIGSTLIGLHQHVTPAPPQRFSEFNVGLDHLAFGCSNRDALEKWVRRLDELGVQHSGIKDAHYGSGLSFRDPDGIALEFFAPPELTVGARAPASGRRQRRISGGAHRDGRRPPGLAREGALPCTETTSRRRTGSVTVLSRPPTRRLLRRSAR